LAVWTSAQLSCTLNAGASATSGEPIPAELLRRALKHGLQTAAFFDAANNLRVVIPGIHEVLRRQGLLEGFGALIQGDAESGAEGRDRASVPSLSSLNDHEFVLSIG